MAGLREVLGYWLKDRAEGESLDAVMQELASELEHLAKRHPALDVAKVESILNAAVHVEWNRKLNTEKFREDVRSIRQKASDLSRLIQSIYSQVNFTEEWDCEIIPKLLADEFVTIGPDDKDPSVNVLLEREDALGKWKRGMLPAGSAMRQLLAALDDDPYLSLGPATSARRGHPGAQSRRRAVMRLRAAGLTKTEAEDLLRIVRVRSYTHQTIRQLSD